MTIHDGARQSAAPSPAAIPAAPRRPLLGRLAAGLTALLLVIAAPGGADAANSNNALVEGASDYITELSRNAIEQLGAKDISPETRAERGRKILEENFAGRDLARFVLGRYWRVATPEQQQRFMTLLRDVAMSRFLPTFQHVSMDQISIERAIADPQAKGVARVITRVEVPNRGPVKLAWRVRPTDDGSYEIVDIMAEGVSMAITLRSEYSSVIEQNGGRIEPLLTRLEERLQSTEAPEWAQN